jgi:hypothetical protein
MTQSQHSQASRAVLTDLIIDAKIRKNLTFKAIAEGTGLSLAFVTAALLGQHPLPADAAKVVADIPLKVHVHGFASAIQGSFRCLSRLKSTSGHLVRNEERGAPRSNPPTGATLSGKRVGLSRS